MANWTQAEIDFVKKYSSKMSRIELWLKFIDKFGYRTFHAVNSYCHKHKIKGQSDGQFKKGHTPFNKGKPHPHNSATKFKKGQPSFRTRPIGAERIDKNGYVVVKVAEPNVWRTKHLAEYERHFGKVPKGYVVRFKDGDKYNFAKDNLIAIPQGANMILNSSSAGLKEFPISEPVINLAHLKYLVGSLQ